MANHEQEDIDNDDVVDQDNTVEDGPDFMNMSDEELLNFNTSAPVANKATEAEVDEEEDSADKEDTGAVEDNSPPADIDEDDKVDDVKAPEVKDGKKDEVVDAGDNAKGKAEKAAVKPEVKADDADKDKPSVEDAKDEDGEVDYKAAYDKLTSGFKANGREIKVKSVDDAISLMQMGANYNKKMAGLKPSMKFLKMLESNDLLDESKLSFLIDLSKKDPAAINKLVSDSGIDPLDLTADKAVGYQPKDHRVNDQEMELDAVLDDLKGSQHYDRTLQVVASEWDQASKKQVTSHPQVLGVINGHMETGVYDIIAAEMESERTFGRLKGLSDLEAYRQIGDAIQARGGFNHLFKGSSPEQKATPKPVVIVQPKPKQADEDVRKQQKRAAAGPKTVASVKSVTDDFSPLALSDDDFKNFK